MGFFDRKDPEQNVPPSEERTPGRGLPTRTIPMLAGALAVGAALFVAFNGNNPATKPSRTPSPAVSSQPAASQAPSKSELSRILESMRGKTLSATHIAGGPSSAGIGIQPTPQVIKKQRALKGNIQASAIIALQGNAGNSAPDINATNRVAGERARSAVPSPVLMRPVTTSPLSQLALLAKKKTEDTRRAFLKSTEKRAGTGYGSVTQILPALTGAVLYPGVVLSATTVTAVNTQLPGAVIAQVTNNVYGRNGHIAVPGGSRLVGQYDTQIRNGQTRILIAFERVIFPDGREIVLGNAQATGQQGASGVKADVNNHFMTMLGASLLVSFLDQWVAGTGPRQSVASPSGGVYQSPLQTGAKTFAKAAGNVLSPFANMQATAVIPPGTAINVLVNKTIVMPEGQ